MREHRLEIRYQQLVDWSCRCPPQAGQHRLRCTASDVVHLARDSLRLRRRSTRLRRAVTARNKDVGDVRQHGRVQQCSFSAYGFDDLVRIRDLCAHACACDRVHERVRERVRASTNARPRAQACMCAHDAPRSRARRMVKRMEDRWAHVSEHEESDSPLGEELGRPPKPRCPHRLFPKNSLWRLDDKT